MKYYIGLLTGTSMDAVDCAIIDFTQMQARVVASYAHPYPQELKRMAQQLVNGCDNELAIAAHLDRKLGCLFANAVNILLDKNQINKDDIIAIGFHGQTVRHQTSVEPNYTIQLGDAHSIAKLTGIKTISNFRQTDIANGGQGAPLAPLFHDYFFAQANAAQPTMILNIGGIANLTYLPTNKKTINQKSNATISTKSHSIVGFDTGPGNCLMDAWIAKQQQQPFDEGGTWAASGTVDQQLLSAMLDEHYFYSAFPKSTGCEYFNVDWLENKLQLINKSVALVDVQASLLELTAQTITMGITQLCSEKTRLIICGGGAYNSQLIERLAQLNPQCEIASSEQYGIAPQWIEAMLFALLAKFRIEHHAVDLSTVTGSQRVAVLGSVYES